MRLLMQYSRKTTGFFCKLSNEEGAKVHACAGERSMKRIAVESVSSKVELE